MFNNLRDAFLDKLDEVRSEESSCTIRWQDTNRVEVIEQQYIRVPSSQSPEINKTYAIVIDGKKRYGIVLAQGTRQHCESVLHKISPHQQSDQSEEASSGKLLNHIDNLFLISVLAKLVNRSHSVDTDEDYTHDTKCSGCGRNPICQVDRYHCLECSSPTYDLCGRCFEKRCQTGKHLSGHAMAHFKLPNEILGIHFNNIDAEVTLNKLKQLDTLRNEQHNGIKCDGVCHQTSIIGLRFKCDTCPKYDLCEPCAITKRVCTKNHEKDHPLILTSNRVMPKIDPDEIEMGEILGRGGFGYVCKAIWRPKNRQVACKVIEISSESSSSEILQRSFLLELAAYRELSGAYILRTYGYGNRKLPATHSHGPKTQFLILMELMGRGSLQNLLERQPHKLSLRRKLAMSRQIASGMRRIHQHGMVHRDIRPDNILITDDYIAKIGDMGIARSLDPSGQQTQIGCVEFMPPEFFIGASSDGHVKCDEKLDIYTYGLTLNQLFTEAMHDFRFAAPLPRVTLTKTSPIFYDEIILRCLDSDSKRRPTAVEIEKTLQFYEEAFLGMMHSDSYSRMNTKQKDQVFIEFYEKNKIPIQRFVKEKFPQEFIKEIPVELSNKQKQSRTPNDEHSTDACRVN
ncbi:unnamed protein product [Rotaria socialis]|uniref:Uncharacterized protein n=1 Tax=Rotaria socialis TaxID=392032 RepID=A0A820DD26_9BILA|nr:unnamed protein product [Rotaria socialis]CAF4230224.1 unnamed protein product [Rotaria socialis]